ncbi:GNAT family N-acetyltransferase [Methanomethylovorans sp.]|uniref:GNAT family N-acetyltransferase n=1 Tax=Methanomethylovorans sp. TaxID=2758717 RepID=UPI00351C0811
MKDNPVRGLIIRSTDVEDVPLLLRFVKGIAEYEHLSHMVSATEESLKMAFFGERPYAEALIAELDSVPVGFVVFFHNFSTFVGKPGLYLEDIYVLPEHRGKGVGAALFMKCVRMARERDCGRMEWSALHWNPARKFYERLGAQPLEDWIIYRLDESMISDMVLEKT